MIRRSYSSKVYISKVLYSEDSIVRRVLFRRYDIPKVLLGTYVPKVLQSDGWSDCVMFDDPTVLRSDWYDSTAKGNVFAPAMCNNNFYRVKFPKYNISVQLPIQSINDEWCIHMTRGRIMRCQRGQAPMIIHVSWLYIAMELNHSI